MLFVDGFRSFGIRLSFVTKGCGFCMKAVKRVYLIIFLLSFGLGFLLSRVSSVPLIYPDEAGYIGWAYKMLYGAGDGLRYLPGYSLFLVPVFALFKDISSAFPVITALNALFTALFAVSVFRLAERLELGNKKLITAAVCLYPAVGLYINFSMCESLLNLCFILLLLSVIRLSDDINKVRRWIVPVILAVFLCLTHSRCIAILPAFVLCLFPKVYKEGRRGIKILYFSVLSVGAFSAIALVLYLFTNTETVNAAHLAGQISGLMSVKGVMSFFGTLISQSSYLVLSTYGFIVAGIYYTVRMIKTNKAAGIFILLSFCFSAVLSAVFMYHHENPAHILYGRYTEYTVYAVLLVGLDGFLKTGIKKRWLVISAVICVVTGLVYGGELFDIGLNITHTWGIYLYKALFYRFLYIPVLIMFAAVAVVIFLAARKRPDIAVMILCGVFAVTTVFAEYDYFYKGASPRRETPQLIHLLENEKEIEIASLTGNSMVYPWEYFNYTVYNPYLAKSDSANMVLSTEKLDFTLVGAEKYSRLKLYSKNGGMAVDLSGEPVAEVKLSENKGRLSVAVQNFGPPWLCKSAADSITEAVRLGLRVYEGRELIGDLRFDFEDNVYNASSLDFDFPYPDGEYTVVAETIREFLYRGGEASYRIEKRNGEITVSECDYPGDEGFSGFDPLDISGVSGFYRYYVTEAGANIPGVYIDGKVLEIETYGEHGELNVEVTGDGKPLQFIKYRDGSYFYRIDKPVTNLRIRSGTYTYSDSPLTFLTTESDFKPVDWFVRGMKKVFGIRLDHRRYGVDIKRIKQYKEDIL